MRSVPWFLALLFLGLSVSGRAADTERSPADYLRAEGAKLHRFVMDNGVVGLVKEDTSAPVVAVQIWIGTGSIHEEELLGAGMSHYLEHMVFKGTEKRGPADISKHISDAGGDINAYTSVDRTVFHTVLPSKSWNVGVEVLSDGVMNASFPEEEWAREKKVVVREMVMGRDDPDRIIYKLLARTAYRVHPYRFPVIGYEDIFETVTREDLAAFFARHYVPDNMTVVVAGHVQADEVEAYVREVMGDFKRRPRAPVVVPEEPTQLSPRYAKETGPFELSRLQWAYHTVPLSHPDAPLLDVLSYVVGHGRSSRAVQRLKEEEKLVYSIDGWSYTPKLAGLFGVSATFDPEKEKEVLRVLDEEIQSWTEELFSEEELDKAKRMLMVGELSALQTMRGQASHYASGEFYAGDPLYSIRYMEAVESATPEQVREVARTYLREHNKTVVVLAPEDEPADVAAVETPSSVPEVTRRELSNGIPLLVREDHRLPFVHICVVANGGLLAENIENNGITMLMADLLTRGTATRNSREIAERVEGLGGSLSPFSGRNSFGIRARCLAADAETFVQLAAECLLQPTFPEDELGKQRAVQLAGIQQRKEDPFQLAMESLKDSLYADHPYRFHESGTEASVAGITRDDLEAHLKKLVVREQFVVSIFGDITADRAQELAEASFGKVPPATTAWRVEREATPNLPKETVRREPREQAILLVGFPGVDVKDPRADTLSLIRDSLSGLSSDLGIEIREKRGLVYYVGAFQRLGLDPGIFVLYAGTREEAVPEVQALMKEQLNRVTGEGLREEEWQRAKEQLIAQHEMSLQDNGGLAQSCALNELYGLGFDYSFSTEERIRAVTPEDIRSAATSIFNEAHQAVSILLPEQKTKQEVPEP